VLVLLVLRVEITGLLALLQLIIPRYRLLGLVFYYSCRLENCSSYDLQFMDGF
jgi:hypothetical protein